MNEVFDIFHTADEFKASTLDEVAGDVTYVPEQLGSMNIFEPKPIRTRTVMLHMENLEIKLVPTSEPYSPEPTPQRGDSEIKYFRTYALRQRDRLTSEDLEDALSLALPLPLSIRNAVEEINERASIMRQNNELTMEYHRFGAIQGKILDADGTSVVRDYFAEFGVAEPVAVNFDFAAIPEGGLVDFIEQNITRPMMRSLGTRKSSRTRVGALVGDVFWGKLRSHKDYRVMFAGTEAARTLGESKLWGSMDFAGVTWINYLGTDDGTTIAVPAKEARFFPINARGVFRTYWSPGERMRDRGTKGQPIYLIVQPDPRRELDEYVDVRVRSYPLFMCTYPKALMRAVTP